MIRQKKRKRYPRRSRRFCRVVHDHTSNVCKRGSRINTKQFPKRAPNVQASGGGGGGGGSGGMPPEKSFGLKLPTITFPVFLNHLEKIFTDCIT